MNDFTGYFYKTPVSVYRAVSGGGYEDGTEFEFIKTVLCDVQPSGGSLEALARGQRAAGTIKVFCGADECLKEGAYLKTGGKCYVISDVGEWDQGLEITAERRNVICG